MGGLDFQLLGIGRTGHVGFNEPGSNINSQTRLVSLDHLTRYDAAGAFHGIENVPSKAITMGIKTILSAKRIVLLAWGINKSEIIYKAVEGSITPNIPTTYLQEHKNTTLVLDHQSASGLTRIKTPWITGNFDWSDKDKYPTISGPHFALGGISFWEEFGPSALIAKIRAEGMYNFGPSLSPTNAFHLMQGIETLPLRMKKHIEK